ncbi:MAG TPA: hypothetical protein VEA69_18590 [Tepidisphaeraceae bacterium]|nr:hypothetical protein [Tepidisphaeraceae bacterium]
MSDLHVLRFADESGVYQPVLPFRPDARPAWPQIGLSGPCSDELMARLKDLDGCDAGRDSDVGDC